MRTIVIFSTVCALSTLGMAGCPPTPPTPPGPDASSDVAPPPPAPSDATPVPTMDSAPTPPPPVADAAPTPPPVVDSGPTPPPPSNDPCVNACNQMNSVGCGQQADCAKVLTTTQANRVIRNPKTTKPLTCNDLVGVKSPSDVKANGWNCK